MEFFLTVTNLFEIHNDTLTEIFHLLAHSPLATRTETQGSQETGAPCTHTTFCIRQGDGLRSLSSLSPTGHLTVVISKPYNWRILGNVILVTQPLLCWEKHSEDFQIDAKPEECTRTTLVTPLQ